MPVTLAVIVPLTAAAYECLLTPYTTSFCAWAFAGLLGLLAGLLYWHRYRGLGFVPLAYSGAAVASGWAAVSERYEEPIAVASFLVGFAYTRMARALDAFSPGLRPLGWVLFALGVFATAFESFGPFVPPPAGARPEVGWFAAVLGLLALFAWVRLCRPAVELFVEPWLWLMYRIRGAGPGLAEVPARGPCLVLANHACWFDPLFLAKVLPRPVTPMMTSRFYDLPVMRWFMRRVFHTIRVPEKPLKQDVPEEIQEAIAALDRGECVTIFPEGYLRRSDDKPLKRFGRGVWQILQARPGTPVFACWIEGGWGSYASYYNGRPTKNKRPDFRRPIGVAVTGPVAVAADTLADHLRTRLYLMNRVAEARKELGLPELPAFELPDRDDDGERPA